MNKIQIHALKNNKQLGENYIYTCTQEDTVIHCEGVTHCEGVNQEQEEDGISSQTTDLHIHLPGQKNISNIWSTSS